MAAFDIHMIRTLRGDIVTSIRKCDIVLLKTALDPLDDGHRIPLVKNSLAGTYVLGRRMTHLRYLISGKLRIIVTIPNAASIYYRGDNAK